MEDLLVLVDENDREIGRREKNGGSCGRKASSSFFCVYI